MGRPTRTLLGKKELGSNIQWDLDRTFNRKTNKNFEWKEGIWRREMKPMQEWQGEKEWEEKERGRERI